MGLAGLFLLRRSIVTVPETDPEGIVGPGRRERLFGLQTLGPRCAHIVSRSTSHRMSAIWASTARAVEMALRWSRLGVLAVKIDSSELSSARPPHLWDYLLMHTPTRPLISTDAASSDS
jgi:hypothetical protein